MTIPARDEGMWDVRMVALLILALVLVRLVVAAATPLAFDEAYYWLWSKALAGGYYDHPPMVALVIRLGTLIAGDTEFGVRLISVLLAIPATWAVWRAAVLLFDDEQLAAAAALFFNLTLIVAAGTVVITPDAPLLAAAAFVLFSLAKVARTGRGEWWLGVGAAMGCALLSKYSALFLGVGIVAWLLIVPQQRRWLLTPWPWLGGLTALVMFLPVILWNGEHHWVSFIKQFGRAAVGGWTLRYVGEHVAAQAGLATPAVFVLGAMGLVALLRRKRGELLSARVLIGALAWPATLYFIWHSLRARVEGNWTAPMFPAFAVAAAVAAHAVHWHGVWAKVADWSRRLAVPIALGMAAVIYAQSVFGIIPLGAVDPTARQLGTGWRAVGVEIDALRREAGARAVLTTSYALTGWLAFYLPSRAPVVQLNDRIRWVNAPEPGADLLSAPAIYVCQVACEGIDWLHGRFETVQELARLPRRRRGVEIEEFAVFRVERPRGDPFDRTPPPELTR